MSTFLSLSDDDIELLNRQFGLKLTREEWNRRLTTTPTFASLVRSYFDWHISELAALAAGRRSSARRDQRNRRALPAYRTGRI